MRYHTVLLDFDNTLVDFTCSQRRALEQCFPGREDAFYERYDAINRAHWERLERGEGTREQLLRDRFVQFLREQGLPDDPDETNRRYGAALAQCCDLIEGALETVRILSARCTVAVVTNGNTASQQSRLRLSGLLPYCKAALISQEAGFAKPDPRIFEEALRRCGISDRRGVLVVGDSLTSDIAGGAAAGLDTCWYNSKGLPAPPDAAPTHTIRSLRELPALVFGA